MGLALAWRDRGCLCKALCLLGGLVALLWLPAANAHLMVAQRGTLNFVGSGGFVVMALPVDAFTGVDDDGDGLMSMAEMRANGATIEAQVKRGLQLIDDNGPRPLEALMLNLSTNDATPDAPAAHLVVLGRFAVALADVGSPALSGLRLRFSLYGRTTEAQRQHIVITHGVKKQQLMLVKDRPERKVFPNAFAVSLDNALLGAVHVLGGLDHLLFLLVVLATGSRVRQIVLALSCFTLGHAITVAGSVLGKWQVPTSIVEPTIAATIIGMAIFDRWSHRRNEPPPESVRLGLIFLCALIHGLGLAGGLADLGLDAEHRVLSLVGFNVGIEIGQLAVALTAVCLLAGIAHVKGSYGVNLTMRFASYLAMAMVGIWLLQRVNLMS